MSEKQKALELADRLDPDADSKNESVICVAELIDAANHIRRLCAENEALFIASSKMIAELRAQVDADNLRHLNHTRMIKGYQDELASLRSELEAARGKVEALTKPIEYEIRKGREEGRLAPRPYKEGDSLPAVGSYCLVSGANCDIESDQHRGFSWRKVIGYAGEFVCLQTHGCWPTVERLGNCWFAEIPHPQPAAPHP